MACNRHKEKRNGTVCPVLRGLAKNVEAEVGRCGQVQYMSFQHLSKHNGRSKVKIETTDDGLGVIVCDNEFGKGKLTVRTPEPTAMAANLRSRLERQGITVAA